LQPLPPPHNHFQEILVSKAQTITQKILAAHCGREYVEPGELILAKVDIALGNDITAPLAIREFRESGARRVFDPERVVLVADHFAPNKDIPSAIQCQMLREFAREQGLAHHYEGGDMGVEHALLPEKGIVVPGDLVIGADSHTCTYGALGAFATGVGSTDLAAAMITGECWFRVPESIRLVYQGKPGPWVTGKDLILHTIGDLGVDGARYMAMEFTGEAIGHLDMAARFTMANMAVEAGAKNGIMAPDDQTLAYVQPRALRPWQVVSHLEPQVALPPSPENVRPLSRVGEVRIDQAVIGSCTNGRLEDLRLAARVLKGRKAAKGVRLIIIPATPALDLFPGLGGRPPEDFSGGRRGGQPAHLRAVLGGTHGDSGPRGGGHRHHQPEFRGPHGPPPVLRVSGQPCRRRGQRGGRLYHRPR